MAGEGGEEGLHFREAAGAGEFEEDGTVGERVVGGGAVVGLGVAEDLEGEVGVVLAGDEGGEEFWVEAVGPGFDWGLNGV